jgi:Tol biopolymer transport system component
MPANGLQVFLHADSGSTGYDLFTATRATSTTSLFSQPLPMLAGINTDQNETSPAVTPDGSVLYFARGAAISHIFRAFSSNGFATANAVVELNNAENGEGSPVPTSDDLHLYFAHYPATGGPDIWVASRTTTSAAYSSFTAVSELNLGAQNRPTWVSPDNCRLYFWSDLDGVGFKLYVASR